MSIDTTPYMEEIREIYLDPCELHADFEEWDDEGRRGVSVEYESTKLQDIKVEKVLLRFADEVLTTLQKRRYPE